MAIGTDSTSAMSMTMRPRSPMRRLTGCRCLAKTKRDHEDTRTPGSLLVDLQHRILAARIREHGVDRDGAPDPVILR
jgi:hypothetical protein